MSEFSTQLFERPSAYGDSRQHNGNVTSTKSNDTHKTNTVNVMNVLTSDWKTTFSTIFVVAAVLCVVVASATGIIHSKSDVATASS